MGEYDRVVAFGPGILVPPGVVDFNCGADESFGVGALVWESKEEAKEEDVCLTAET